jgi:hypothetical protein
MALPCLENRIRNIVACRDDPLVFKDGFIETWRNGDPSGCVMRDAFEEEVPFGTPGLNASSLALLYEWE